MVDSNELRNAGLEEYLKERNEDVVKNAKKYTPEEIAEITANRRSKVAEMDVVRKEAFLRTISSKSSRAKDWKLVTVTSGSQFAAAAANARVKLTRVNVSDSNLDDLMVTAGGSGEIQLVSRKRDDHGSLRAEVAGLSASSGVLATLPVRLNLDGLNDLIVLREGSPFPSVVMSAPSAVFFVTNASDSTVCVPDVDCSLRGAILAANSNPGNDIIAFALPVGTVISPQSPLPSINSTVSIQSGNLPDGTRGVEISGVNAGASVDGLKIRASNVFVYSIAVSGFKSTIVGGGPVGGNGIVIASDSGAPNIGNNAILACFLGTDVTGNVDHGNDATGLLIFDSDSNGIRDSLLSGNGYGIGVTDGNSNSFANNIFGLNAAGTAKLGNFTGILLTGANNTVGGDLPGDGNTISGNGVVSNIAPCIGYGIEVRVLADATTLELLTHENLIKGNRIGTNPSGTIGFGNCWQGVLTSPITATTIGSITETGRNTVSDNGLGGITCGDPNLGPDPSEGGYCSIAGNNIGTDITGSFAIGNDIRNIPNIYGSTGAVGVMGNISLSNIGAPGGITPGGPCTGFCNLIAGNGGGFTVGAGVITGGLGVIGIFNNSVGTNREGTQALGNPTGVGLASSIIPDSSQTVFVGGNGLQDGQTVALGNLISGNQSGLVIGTFFTPNLTHYAEYLVAGNLIGTDRSGTTTIPINGHGIGVGTGPTDLVRIGSSDPLDRNIISGNTVDGINMFSSVNTTILNNSIGVNASFDARGNGGSGISISQFYAYSTVVGGAPETANVIANNGGTGVRVNNAFQGSSASNSIRGNSIYNNGGLGIDLNAGSSFNPPNGVTENDCMDGDLGPNMLQNFPSLFAPTANGDGSLTVTGYLRSSAAEEYQLDFYSNPVGDPSGYGEGSIYIGSKQIRTSGNGFTSFSFNTPENALNITATATDGFSCIAGQCADPFKTAEEAESILGTSTCTDPIVVNEDFDNPDADIEDGVCDRDTDIPGLQCTLRAAMQEAEHQTGFTAIAFNIPGAGPITIHPLAALPDMTQPVSIDASTQPGYTGVPLITVNGESTANIYGFRIAGGNSLIRGLAVINFKEQIGLSNSGSGIGNNRVTGNYIGLRPSGNPGTKATQQFGIALVGATTNNRIGGLSPEDRNVISGNQVGISIASNSTNNNVLGNFIGTIPQGSAALGNDYGISIQNSSQNHIGSTIDSGTNVISGNLINGIEMVGTSSNNKVTGNLIGTDISGTLAIGNKHGVEVRGSAANNTIGGTTAEERNIISGQDLTNNGVGVLIGPDAGDNNLVTGNLIGLTKDASQPLPNRIGIAVNADNQIIGSANNGDFKNVIVSANTLGGYGIYLHPFFPNDELYNVTVRNNIVGTALPNNAPAGYVGIFLFENVKSAKITGNVVGHQSFSGIRLEDGPHNNTISENLVGIDPSNDPIPNFNGVVVKQADTNFIKNNVVSGNTEHGIVVGDGFGQNDLSSSGATKSSGISSFAIQNIITGNKVGTNIDGTELVPNGAVGIGLGANARDNTVGGAGALGNFVGGATGDFGLGIFVGIIDDAASPNLFPMDNKIKGNRVGIGTDETLAGLGNRYGIYVRNASGTIVGGDVATEGNVVCNNQADGIRLFKPGTTDTTVQHNYVGVTANGVSSGNAGDGISIDGAVRTLLQENTVGGNIGNGIAVQNIDLPAEGRKLRPQNSFLTMIGNSVGVIFVNGKPVAVPNLLAGLSAIDVSGAQIGLASSAANIFAANNGPGMTMLRGAANKIENLLVGTDNAGTAGLGNGGPGIKVEETVGAIFAKITVAGNNDVGILAQNMPGTEDDSPSLTVSEANVGVVKLGNGNLVARKNLLDGMKVVDVHKFLIGVEALNGQGKNTFSANGGRGLAVQSTNGDKEASGKINHTIFGTSLSGQAALGNEHGGLELNNAVNVVVGSLDSNLKVTFADNGEFGAFLKGPAASAIKLIGTHLGVAPNGEDPLGNNGPGVILSEGAHDNVIGGPDEGAGNLIAFNTGPGVMIDETAGSGNVVDPNSIHSNTGLGIDLGAPGHTPNDAGDADEGPNRLQNYPAISSFDIDGNGDLIVNYKVDSMPGNSNYGTTGIYIEFFKAGIGSQGELFLGFDHYSEGDHGGSANLKTKNLGYAAALGFTPGNRVTATSTDAEGNTSEFTPVFGPTAAHVYVGGRVMDAYGRPIGKATIRLSDMQGRSRTMLTSPFGYYRFDSVEVGQSVVLEVRSKRHNFAEPTRVLFVNSDFDGVNFVAEP